MCVFETNNSCICNSLVSLFLASWVQVCGLLPHRLISLGSQRANLHSSPQPSLSSIPPPRNLEKALKERKLAHPPLPSLPAAESSIIRPSLSPIMKPKLSATHSTSWCFSCRPLLLIVPETTDGNCERKHVNSAGVMAETNTEQRSSPTSRGSYYNMKRGKAFRKQPLCVRRDSCQDPTHRSTNKHMQPNQTDIRERLKSSICVGLRLDILFVSVIWWALLQPMWTLVIIRLSIWNKQIISKPPLNILCTKKQPINKMICFYIAVCVCVFCE